MNFERAMGKFYLYGYTDKGLPWLANPRANATINGTAAAFRTTHGRIHAEKREGPTIVGFPRN